MESISLREEDFFEMTNNNYILRAQIPIVGSRFDYLLNSYKPNRNDKWIMFHHPGHFYIYDNITKHCIFDVTYIEFPPSEVKNAREERIVAVIPSIKINKNKSQWSDNADDDWCVADIILKEL